MMSYLKCVVVLLLVSNASQARGSEIKFQASSSTIQPLLTSNFTLRCSLKDTPSSLVGRSLSDDAMIDAQGTDDIPDHKTAVSTRSVTQTSENMAFVTSIIISRDGVDLAIVTEHLAATAEDGMTGFTVSGKATGSSGERGYLELTWPHPSQAEIGGYRCDIDTLSVKGHSYDFSKSLEIDESNVSVTDLVSYIHGMTLENEQTSKIIQEMKATIGNMKTENEALKKTFEALKSVARTEPKIFFSAVLTTAKTLSSNAAVIFDMVYTNEGSAYNNQNGIFTAPLNGFYSFDIHTHTYGSKWSYVMIRHNGADVVPVYCYSGDHIDCSKGVTLKLTKNDKIDVISRQSSSTLYSSGSTLRLNVFSGELIALA